MPDSWWALFQFRLPLGYDSPVLTRAGWTTAPKPRWRGRIHQASVPVALAAGATLATLTPAGEQRFAVGVYAVALAALFAVSAAYHRGRWGQRVEAVLRRADHSTILLFIAETFTPVAVTVTSGQTRSLLLLGMWLAAGVGVAIRMRWHHVSSAAVAWVYAAVGISAVSVLPALFQRSGVAAFTLFVLGGVVYLLGALVYARRKPDPRPSAFGFHEVFHSLTVMAAALQFTGLSLSVLGTRA